MVLQYMALCQYSNITIVLRTLFRIRILLESSVFVQVQEGGSC